MAQFKLERIKYAAAAVIKTHPYSWSLIWNALPRVGLLLPHEKSYYGFRHIATDPQGLFLDVGANNGISAAGFRHLNKTYDILSIEANLHHEKSLRSLKKALDRFDYRILGAGDSRNQVTIYTPMYRGIPIHTHSSTSLSYLEISLGRDFSKRVVRKITYDQQTVAVIPLDDLNLAPSIVKVDVEGFDYQVLLGLQATIDKHRPFFHIEYTPQVMGDFRSFFDRRSYQLFVFDPARDLFLPFRDERETQTWRTSGLQVNLFCVPHERVARLPVAQGD